MHACMSVCTHIHESVHMSQAWKVGYGIWKMVHALLNGSKAGMLVDAQASQLDLTAHVQSFPTQEGKQMIMTSFNDVTVVLHMLREGGLYKGACTSLWGSLGEFSGDLVIVEVISCLLAAGVH